MHFWRRWIWTSQLIGATCATLLAAPASGNWDVMASAGQAEARLQCRDEQSARVLKHWLSVFPSESTPLIPDPVVRQAAKLSRTPLGRQELQDAGFRMYVDQASKQGRINRDELSRQLAALKREFGSYDFPMSLEQALRLDTQAARLFVAQAARSIRARPGPNTASELARRPLRHQPVEEPVFNVCGDVFRTYLASIDERVAFVPAKRVVELGSNPYLQQIERGTDVAYTGPGEGCQRSPTGDAFFKRKPDGRLAGRYSSLGFPEAVQLAFFAGERQWTCSGVLLSEKWVLTAAHCVDDDGRAAGQPVTASVMVNDAVAIVRRARNLPVYSETSGKKFVPDAYLDAVRRGLSRVERGPFDVALLELSTPLTIGASLLRDSARAPDTLLGTLAGFGATLQGPAAAVANAPLDVGWLRVTTNQTMVSWAPLDAQGPAGNASCPGDSGAPIFMTLQDKELASEAPAIGCVAEKRELIGLVSYGQSPDGKSCVRGSNGSGPRLQPHLGWICQTTGQFCN